MSNPNRDDIERSLVHEMKDEEALDIMEGRRPISEHPNVDLSARDLARELLKEPAAQGKTGGGSADVVVLFKKQPWMRMAAALLLGVAVTTFVDTGIHTANVTETPPSSLATANVVYLEVMRGAGKADAPTVRIGKESWVSFLLYPDFTDADILRIFVERSISDRQQMDTWTLVLEDVTGVGGQDSLVVNVSSKLLQPGIHRLRVDSEKDGQVVRSMDLQFSVEHQR